MNKSILNVLLLSVIFITMLTSYNSVLALRSSVAYCSGLYCNSQSDCGTSCFCSYLDNKCYDAGLPKS
jgi:hypothetical protein